MTDTFRRSRAGRRSEGGFSLIEVVIAGVILVLIVGVAARTLAAGHSLLGAVSREVSGDVVAQQLASQIAGRIRNGIIADVTDGFGNPLNDGMTSYIGIRVRLLNSLAGGSTTQDKGKTVAIITRLDDPPSNTTPWSLDRNDNDGDNLVDEGRILVKEWPGDDPVGDYYCNTATEVGVLAANTGLIYTASAPAGEPTGIDPRGVWDRADPSYFKYVYPGIIVTRNGDRLKITVGILRADRSNLDRNRNPILRCYMATTYVSMRN